MVTLTENNNGPHIEGGVAVVEDKVANDIDADKRAAPCHHDAEAGHHASGKRRKKGFNDTNTTACMKDFFLYPYLSDPVNVVLPLEIYKTAYNLLSDLSNLHTIHRKFHYKRLSRFGGVF